MEHETVLIEKKKLLIERKEQTSVIGVSKTLSGPYFSRRPFEI